MNDDAAGSFISGYEAYWRRSTEEVESAIKSSTIVFDTNALIHLYRMTAEGRAEFFAVLEHVSDRLWIPRQVVDEFHRVRLSAVASHISGLKNKSDAVSVAAEALKSALADFARLYSLADGKDEEYMKPLNTAISGILAHVKRDVEAIDLVPGALASHDPIMDRLAGLLQGKVGSGITPEELPDALKEAERRGKEKIPPGFKDWEQKGADGVGDYLIWREMIGFAQTVDRAILFVSSDEKVDWLRKQAGLVIGPRPELVREMMDKANSAYHHLTLADFLGTASRALGVFVSSNTISRAKELERDRVLAATRSEVESNVLAARHVLDATQERHDLTMAKVDNLHRRIMENEWRAKRLKDRLRSDLLTLDEMQLARDQVDALTAEIQQDKIERAELRREASRLGEEVSGLKASLWAFEGSLEELNRSR